MVETSLSGKVALVTGGARRIGAEIVRALHAAGAVVVVHYRHSHEDAQALQCALNGLRAGSCHLLQGDLLETDGLPQLVAGVVRLAGRLDVLVNNASSFYPTAVGSITGAQWDDLLGINLKAPLFLAQAAADELRQHNGCIVNLVDIHGMRPLLGYPLYSVTKAGMLMLTQALARELGPEVRVNGVAPGAILWPETGMSSQQREELLSRTVLKRTGEAADIAKAVLFLVRDAPYVTGQVLAVDGGRILNH